MNKLQILNEEIGRFDDIRLTCHYFSDGSPQAEQLADKYINDQQLSELD